jgi:hypothetical protein
VFIVKDEPGYLPKQVEKAKEVVMVVQEFNCKSLKDMAKTNKDKMFKTNSN